MVNPLLKGLPKLVLVLQCTCNGFKAPHVKAQWVAIRRLWHRPGGLGDILGPLVGHGSDGDARRESAMLADMSSPGAPDDGGKTAGTMYAFPWDGMTIFGFVDEHGVFALHSQDTIHNAKKLLNPMDQSARLLQVGLHLVSWEHVIRAGKHVPPAEHDLRLQDLVRQDRQNFEVVMRACSPRTRAALRKFGEDTGEDVAGTIAWLGMLHSYILAFFGKKLTMKQRWQRICGVLSFLRIMRNFLRFSKPRSGHVPYDLKKHFCSRQTFNHLLISCHGALLKMRLARDLGAPLHLSESGSDCCEHLFSGFGGCGKVHTNRRNYDFGAVLEMASDQNEVQRMLSDPDEEVRLDAAKAHRKMEVHDKFLGEMPGVDASVRLEASDTELWLLSEAALASVQQQFNPFRDPPGFVFVLLRGRVS